MNNKPVALSNEALIKSGKKPSFVVPFRMIIHLFGTSFPKENSLAVILNAVTTSAVRFQIHAIVPNCSLTLPVYMQSVTVWINSLTRNAYMASGLEAYPFPVIS